ncbi:MAG: hypothetical protein JSS10_01595 [Verrucomicrobia bacterium]|nr:hypothetical protein [Verrucomicrobiota bacterium]
MEISDFYTLLEKATTVEEEVFDIRFEKIVSLVEKEKFAEAVPLITTILNEGKVDIRLVMYLFYADVLAKGIGCLKEIFPAIMSMLDPYWESVSPVQMRDNHASISLTWFLSSVVKKLKRSEKLHKEKKVDDFWTKSVESLQTEEIEELKTTTEHLGQFLTQKLEDTSLHQYLMFISKWLDGLSPVVAEQEPPKVEKKSPEPASPKSPPVKPSEKTPAKEISLQKILVASEPMMVLFKKIQVFEALIEKQDFEKAALVSDDISATIKNFDPVVFFPKLFSRYFALTATHSETLSDECNNKASLKWESLSRLYQNDIEEFIVW